MVSLTEHAIQPTRCTTTELMTLTGEAYKIEHVIAVSDEYLKMFVVPVYDEHGRQICFHCGSRRPIVWGLRHGEASCSNCGWPARGMHSPADSEGNVIYRMTNFFLSYHPDMVTLNG